MKQFRKYAHDNGFPLIAMGHYAKRIDKDGFTYLYKADDLTKDQSYFLAEVEEEKLRENIIPISKYNQKRS